MSKILIIDDKSDNLLSIKAIINNHRPTYEVITAQSGKDGLKLAKTEKPDTILLDILMPKMDGYEVCKQLKKDVTTKHIPIVFLTAIKTSTQDRIKGLDMGAEGYITKPVEPGDLIAQVNVMLRIKKSEDKLRDDKEVLEEKVAERTRDILKTNTKLKSRNKELETWFEVTVDRELKMLELKKEINELLEKSGEKPKYEIPV